jgi:hypothetical protein
MVPDRPIRPRATPHLYAETLRRIGISRTAAIVRFFFGRTGIGRIAHFLAIVGRQRGAGVTVLGRNDADDDLAGPVRVGAVEGDRRYRPTAHPFLGFLARAVEEAVLPVFGLGGMIDHRVQCDYERTARWPRRSELSPLLTCAFPRYSQRIAERRRPKGTPIFGPRGGFGRRPGHGDSEPSSTPETNSSPRADPLLLRRSSGAMS